VLTDSQPFFSVFHAFRETDFFRNTCAATLVSNRKLTHKRSHFANTMIRSGFKPLEEPMKAGSLDKGGDWDPVENSEASEVDGYASDHSAAPVHSADAGQAVVPKELVEDVTSQF